MCLPVEACRAAAVGRPVTAGAGPPMLWYRREVPPAAQTESPAAAAVVGHWPGSDTAAPDCPGRNAGPDIAGSSPAAPAGGRSAPLKAGVAEGQREPRKD